MKNGKRKWRGDLKERYEALRDTIKNHHSWKRSVSNDLAIIETLAKTGMRCAELANLKVGDIDLRKGRVLSFVARLAASGESIAGSSTQIFSPPDGKGYEWNIPALPTELQAFTPQSFQYL